ncbi:hypothetical protein [Gemmatimonas phototrophica]|uniref:hypothetical protein n=1 Tax=Gemmatimonas phototrophica TaxID=1379270 RepID=UPI0006A7503B|nr:hypothetical protein [Gemmatimonas phototrophica]
MLLLVFNRPAVVRELVAALRVNKPPVVYVAGDGPRTTHPADTARCAEVREVIARDIDWPCSVRTWFRETNVGLQRAVVSGIDWLFSHETAGVILEDDCLPAPDFLPFAGAMLERYADTPSVMQISGVSMRSASTRSRESYHYAQVGHIWGWATWRRAWAQYDPTLSTWPAVRDSYRRDPSSLRRALAAKFASAHAGRKWTWSRAWYWSTVQQRGLSVIPSLNLIHNVGDGEDATHQHGARHPLRRVHEEGLTWPLVHPPRLVTDDAYDQLLTRYHRGSFKQQLTERWWALREQLA